MKNYPLVMFIISLVLFSCAAKKKIIMVNAGGGDGSSYEQAIIINETHESPGTADEYNWLQLHYPHYQNKGQALSFYQKKPYDIISIITHDDQKLSIYFDISKFYGRF
jgi:hypothetical protein